MRVAYLECFAGISGDMFLGALLDAGVEVAVLEEATAALGLGATLSVRKVDRSGITATKVDVLEGGRLAEAAAESAGVEEQATHEHRHQPRTQHLHKGGHVHDHGSEDHGSEDHGSHEHMQHEGEHSHGAAEGGHHHHGRSLTAIRALIDKAALAGPVKTLALEAFTLLGHSEAKIHNVPVDAIHFHEVGAVDAIVDIVAASAGIHALGERAARETGEALEWHCSALNVGGGTVQCAHGTFPVPAPATADLLRGLPTYSAHVQKELVTPTGAALLRALRPEFGVQPAMRVSAIGYGAGSRDPKGFPNVLRLSVGEAGEACEAAAGAMADRGTSVSMRKGGRLGAAETVVVLQAALDDSTPQVLAYAMERALAEGALDVMTTAVGMKKGRPGTLLTVLASEADADSLAELLLRETSTLGVRRRAEQRTCLERRHQAVATEFGSIRVKVGSFEGADWNAQPEFEDCRAAAEAHRVPLKRVLAAAHAAYAALALEPASH